MNARCKSYRIHRAHDLIITSIRWLHNPLSPLTHNDSASHTFPPTWDMQQRLSVSGRGLFSSGSEFIYTVFNHRRVALRFVRTVRLFNDLHQLKAFTKVTIPLAAILEGGKRILCSRVETAEKFRNALKTFGNIYILFYFIFSE